jgi:hypothetical protein
MIVKYRRVRCAGHAARIGETNTNTVLLTCFLECSHLEVRLGETLGRVRVVAGWNFDRMKPNGGISRYETSRSALVCLPVVQ